MLYLYVDTGAQGRSAQHRNIGHAAVACVCAHIAWFLIMDNTVVHYFALSAPAYMLAGLVAVGCMALVVMLARPTRRRYWHASYPQFRRWHKAVSLLAIGASLWHIAGCGFYLSRTEALVLCALTLIIVAARHLDVLPNSQAPRSAVWVLPAIAAVFVGLKQII